jgi:hypothetical protein
VILVRGRERAVVLSAEHYQRLARKGSLATFLRNSPWADVELDLSRSTDTGRPVEL